ncbi:MAG: ATP-binding protein [Candidatus Eisenbacteria sp.]|nr:ATP-binding protein [Candidatus Eisenbacteria bacterium]
MTNPFKYGGIVGRDAFCNRTQEMRDLRRAIENCQNLFLYSERRFGKTSLVKQVIGKLPNDKYLAIYADLWATDNEESFITELAGAISLGLESKADRILHTAKRLFGGLAPAVSLDSDGNPQLTFAMGTQAAKAVPLTEVLTVPETLARRRKRQVVVVFDEFQRILEYGDDRVERTIRSVIQHHQRVAYIFLASRKHLIRQMFLDQNRPLYRSGEHYPLGPIAAEHWQSFIRTRFRRSDKDIGSELIKTLCETTEGHPFYTQHLCHVVWERCKPGGRVTPRMLESAISMLLDRESYAYIALWESFGINHRRFLTGLAHEPRGRKVYASDFLRKYGLRSPSGAQRVVRTLMESDVVDRDNGSFLISDRFFRIWIRRTTSQFAYGM